MKHIFSKLKHSATHLSTPVAIIVGSLIISLGLIGYGFITKGTSPQKEKQYFAGSGITDKDYVYGNADASVIVIEYSDTECPYCISLHPTIKNIQSAYGDKLAFVYRHFPLTQIHPKAFDEARAISCAGAIGGAPMYYSYINALFDYKYNNRTTQLSKVTVADIAKNTGLDVTSFNTCMSSGQTTQTVSAQQQDGVTAGVQGTPATFILLKTRKGLEIVAAIDGAQPQPVFDAAIKEALNR